MKRILLLIAVAELLFTAGAERGRAAEKTRYSVQAGGCKSFRLENRAWKPSNAQDFPGGSTVEGVPMVGQPGWILVERNGRRYILKESCLRPSPSAAAPENRPPRVASAGPGVQSSGPRGLAFSFFIQGLSWQEGFALDDGAGNLIPLIASNLGYQLGVEWRRFLSPRSELDFAGALILASSDIGIPSSVQAPAATYSAVGNGEWGISLETGYGFRPHGDTVEIGPRLIVVYRSSSWPDPPFGYTISGVSGINAALLMQVKLELARFYLSSSAGFYGAASNLYWSIGLGFRL